MNWHVAIQKKKMQLDFNGIDQFIVNLLDEIQDNLFLRAQQFRSANMHRVDSYEEFKTRLEKDGGFYLAHWDGTAETEEKN